MTYQATLNRTADGWSMILPPEIVENLGLKEGDSLYVAEMDAGVLLTLLDPEFLEAMERGTAKYANVLRELAKYDTHTDSGQ